MTFEIRKTSAAGRLIESTERDALRLLLEASSSDATSKGGVESAITRALLIDAGVKLPTRHRTYRILTTVSLVGGKRWDLANARRVLMPGRNVIRDRVLGQVVIR